jgi:hypothetical protein
MFMGLIAAAIARAYPDLPRNSINSRWLRQIGNSADAPAALTIETPRERTAREAAARLGSRT